MQDALAVARPGIIVERADVVQVSHGTCTLVRVALKTAGPGADEIPARVIVKSGFESHSAKMAYLHEMEVRAYRDVFAPLGLPSPACLFAEFDDDERRGVVILEDLSLRGVEFCSPLRPRSPDEIARWLDALARFHAQTWNSVELTSGRWGWMPEHTFEFRKRMAEYLQPEEWERVIRAPRGAAVSVRFHDRGWAASALDKLVDAAARRPHAVLHGDAHLGNLYLDGDGRPGFFDPLTRRGPVMRDVSYLIGGGLDIADRRATEHELLQGYADGLVAHGVPVDESRAAVADYATWLALGYLVFLVNDTAFQPEAVNTAMTTRFGVAMIDNGTTAAIELLP